MAANGFVTKPPFVDSTLESELILIASFSIFQNCTNTTYLRRLYVLESLMYFNVQNVNIDVKIQTSIKPQKKWLNVKNTHHIPQKRDTFLLRTSKATWLFLRHLEN